MEKYVIKIIGELGAFYYQGNPSLFYGKPAYDINNAKLYDIDNLNLGFFIRDLKREYPHLDFQITRVNVKLLITEEI